MNRILISLYIVKLQHGLLMAESLSDQERDHIVVFWQEMSVHVTMGLSEECEAVVLSSSSLAIHSAFQCCDSCDFSQKSSYRPDYTAVVWPIKVV